MKKISQGSREDISKNKISKNNVTKKQIEQKHILAVIAVILFVVIMIKSIYVSDSGNITELVRPSIGEDCMKYLLDIEYEDSKYRLDVDIGEKTYNPEEMEQLFEYANKELLSVIKGENEDLLHVNKNLELVDRLDNFNMDVYWLTDTDYINYWGEIEDVDAAKKVILIAQIKYRGNVTPETQTQKEYEVPVVIYPKEYTQKEQIENDIRKLIENEDLLNQFSDKVELPDKYEGKNISYSMQKEKPPYIVFILLPATGILAFLTKKEKGKEARKKVVKQMEIEYPDILLKLSILVGAGMTTFNAMSCIADDYENLIRKGELKKPGYEEIRSVINKVNSGIPEWKAYSEMGMTDGARCYIKLGSLLVQNITKGNDSLRNALDIEMKESFKSRKTNAVIIGEKAGTKLLAPMIMMLMVVLTIIMVPAFMSF